MKPTLVIATCLLAACSLRSTPPTTEKTQQPLALELDHLDSSVRPQDDLYRFVNGGWLETAQIPADRSRWGTFIELAERSEAALREIVEEAAASDAQAGTEARKIGDLFQSYMDTERIEALGLTPIQDALDRVASLETHAELPALFASLLREYVQTPVGFAVWQDQKQSSRYIAYLGQSGLGLPDRDYYLKEEARFLEIRDAYRRYIETLFTLAGLPDAQGAAETVLTLETELAMAHWDRVQNRDREKTYNLHTFEELDALTPDFSWSTLFEKLGAEDTPGVVVRQPDYLPAMVATLGATDLPKLRQYLTFKVLDDAASLLGQKFEAAHFEFREKTLRGTEEPQPRWRRAVNAVNASLGEAVGKLYVERHFKPEAKARMQEMVDNLREAFRQGIDGLEWMSPATRAEAHAKLAKFNVKIGHPDVWRDYGALEIRPDELVGNLRRSAEFEFQREVDRLGQPIDRNEWHMTPQRVNAYYSPTMNEIVFPAAILQPPFFDPEADDALNYGAIGGVIGHEISHGFDDQGARSDGDGNLRDWWTPEDKAAFVERTARLASQYDTFSPLEGLHVNGKLSLGENIGDLSGLTVAYRAWRLSQGDRADTVIGGFTGPQRFFLGWARIWRSLYRDDAMRQQLLTGPHSPGEYRVNGVVRNMPEFHEAFGVKEGDGAWLAPEERVRIW